MRSIVIVAGVLVVVGALNWGLVGLFQFNLVASLFGTGAIASIVYVLVGLAGVFLLVQSRAMQKRWCAAPSLAH